MAPLLSFLQWRHTKTTILLCFIIYFNCHPKAVANHISELFHITLLDNLSKRFIKLQKICDDFRKTKSQKKREKNDVIFDKNGSIAHVFAVVMTIFYQHNNSKQEENEKTAKIYERSLLK